MTLQSKWLQNYAEGPRKSLSKSTKCKNCHKRENMLNNRHKNDSGCQNDNIGKQSCQQKTQKRIYRNTK